ESSKIVPTLTENCFRQPRHVQSLRVLINDTLRPWHLGHSGPLGHLTLATVSRQTIGSEKYRMAACKPLVFIALSLTTRTVYHRMECESSDLLPKFAPRSAQ